MAITIPIPSSDEAQKIAVNRSSKGHTSTVLPLDQKLAAVLLKLAPAVTPANYPAIGAAINNIVGIRGVELLIDGQTPASIPANMELILNLDVQLRIEPTGV